MKKITKKVEPVIEKPVIHQGSHNAQLRGPSKTFQQDGHWIEKPNKTPVLHCSCGNRYLKTRPNQVKCLRCMSSSTIR